MLEVVRNFELGFQILISSSVHYRQMQIHTHRKVQRAVHEKEWKEPPGVKSIKKRSLRFYSARLYAALIDLCCSPLCCRGRSILPWSPLCCPWSSLRSMLLSVLCSPAAMSQSMSMSISMSMSVSMLGSCPPLSPLFVCVNIYASFFLFFSNF